MQSMTGFGRGSAPASLGGEWSVECSSINRKQLEVQWTSPKVWAFLEGEVRRMAAARFQRGRILVTLIPPSTLGTPRSTIDPQLAQMAADDLRCLSQHLGLVGPLTLDQLLRHPLLQSPTELDTPPLLSNAWAEIEPAVKQGLAELETARRREGAALQTEIDRLFALLQATVRHIAERAPGVPLHHRELLLERLRQADLVRLPDEGRLAMEIAIFADRCDITEELARLESHLSHFQEILHESGPCGRPLEFVTQEMHRELNTTGAKSADPAISRSVVEGKTTLEKIREQLANVE